MTLQQEILYHQIHPAKLLTDWAAGFAALYFFWERLLLPAMLVSIVPPLVVSGILIRFTNLEKFAETKSGRFVKQHMTPARELRVYSDTSSWPWPPGPTYPG
jgi:hypothetical protein